MRPLSQKRAVRFYATLQALQGLRGNKNQQKTRNSRQNLARERLPTRRRLLVNGRAETPSSPNLFGGIAPRFLPTLNGAPRRHRLPPRPRRNLVSPTRSPHS